MAANKNYLTYELSLRMSDSDIGSSELLKNVLNQLGVAEESIVAREQYPYLYLSTFNQSYPQTLTLKNRIQSLKLKKVQLRSKTLKREDWATKWQKDFKPFQLSKYFDVVPMRFRKKYRPQQR